MNLQCSQMSEVYNFERYAYPLTAIASQGLKVRSQDQAKIWLAVDERNLWCTGMLIKMLFNAHFG